MLKTHLPKWATPERRTKLLELWAIYGNQCLLGHTACPIPEHYINVTSEGVIIGKPVLIPCTDGQGNIRRDSEGNPITITLYKPVTIPTLKAELTRLYDVKSEQLIDGWKADDREARTEQQKLEAKYLHSLGEPKNPLRGRFSAISQDIWKSNQPLYYIEGIGVSGLTLKPFVRIRLKSSFMRLYVNLGDTLRGISKAKKRKAIRYNKPLPLSVENQIQQLVKQSVLDYLK